MNWTFFTVLYCESGSHVNERLQGLAYHPYIYSQMKWPIPSHRASLHFGQYSFPIPPRVGGWVVLGNSLHTELVCPADDGHPSQYYNWARHRNTLLQHQTSLQLCQTVSFVWTVFICCDTMCDSIFLTYLAVIPAVSVEGIEYDRESRTGPISTTLSVINLLMDSKVDIACMCVSVTVMNRRRKSFARGWKLETVVRLYDYTKCQRCPLPIQHGDLERTPRQKWFQYIMGLILCPNTAFYAVSGWSAGVIG